MDLLRRAFRDITAGHTPATVLGRACYIRHLSHADQIDVDERRERFRQDAIGQSILTDAEREAELLAAGQWTAAKEAELQRAKAYIGELEVGKRNPKHHPSMVTGYVRKIEEATKDYEAKAWAKRQLMGLTAEVSADREVNDHYIVTNLFADPALNRPLFAADFDYLKEEDVNAIVKTYNTAMECCSARNIRRLAMHGDFQRYFRVLGDDVSSAFGRPAFQLSFYQVDLLAAGAQFRSIYQNHDIAAFPKNVLEDPDLLVDYVVTVTKGKADLAAQGANEPGTIVVGAKAEDAKALGIKQPADPMKQIMSQFGGDVMAWAAKKGA